MSFRSKSRGLTLMEAMITMVLVGGIFVVIADLLEGAAKTIHFQSYKSVQEQAEQLALKRMLGEAREAVTIDATGTNVLKLTRIDDSNPTRLSAIPASPPWPNTDTMSVSYTLDSAGNLMRALTVGGSSPLPQLIAQGLNVFTTSRDSTYPCNLDLTVTIQENDLVKSVTATVWVPTSP